VPIFDQIAQEYVALSITLDVTASVHNQLKIEERNRDLSEFTYMISHDLKAPIVTLRGMLEVIRDEIAATNTKGLGEPVDYMSKAVSRLEQLVGGVLELARVSTAEQAHEPVSLQETVQEVIDDYRFQIDSCKAHIATPEELPWVFGNKTQLYQIFSNLIGNAIKYRSPDRPLVVTIRPQVLSSRRRVEVAISDNGKGIPEQYRESIFKPFNRAGEQLTEGSGIGLACVKRLVEKLGGTIRVDSTVGAGSVFTIEFRRASREA
jgi:signal transduction histidine kinase